MDIKKLIALGKAVAQLDPRAAGAIAVVEKVVDVIDDIRDAGNDDAELAETREELEARVNAHADSTAGKLAD